MTTWNAPHHVATARAPAADPLTDSGVRRAFGTQVRLHLAEGAPIDVGLLDVKDVSTWSDLAMFVSRRMPMQIEGAVRMVFSAGVILWAEVLVEPS